ncbi:MFS transporter [Sporolituus thermophilus]|uniref:Predicted arabinose efflux permease, MFS family n=1 Tax=Sporolituus thermophilus DSM 23256 TaxID=1123285 RepID=A0A1G7LVW5_9FIRM|nr:MFS transporter [Sporolituus thermophilus]SDF53635.1 Predicted arabinose efflux permease, MFS family [Sporolituus thermophilus DSM 23256]
MERVMLGVAVGFCWFSLYTYVAILPGYALSLGASYKMVGLITGAYGFTQMALRLPLGVVSDFFGRRKIFIIWGLVFCAVSGFGLWYTDSVWGLLFFRGLAGIAATAWVLHTILFVSYYPADRTPQAMGIINAVSNGGQLLALFLGGLIAMYISERATFLLGAVGGSLGLLVGLFVKDAPVAKPAAVRLGDLFKMAQEPMLALTSLLAMILQLLTYGAIYGFTPVVARKIGVTNFELGMLPALFTVPGVFASFFSGTFFTERVGIRRTLLIGFVLTIIACVAIPYCTSIWELYATQFVSGFGRGLLFPVLMALSLKNIDPAKKTTAMGYFQTVYGAGMFVGPVVCGLIADSFGLVYSFWAIGLILTLGAVSAQWLFNFAAETHHSTFSNMGEPAVNKDKTF